MAVRSGLGIEVELQILDSSTGNLSPGSIEILSACKEEKIKGVTAEFMQSMIELKTGICESLAEAEKDLSQTLEALNRIATKLGYKLGFSGTHPFNEPSQEKVYPDERYKKISDRMASAVSHDVVFGVHVHIGVGDSKDLIPLLNHLVQYIPQLIALSANSPYWRGVDTGLASSRSAFYAVNPHSGIPPYFSDTAEFRRYLELMLHSKLIGSLKDIYWDLRPRPDFGTLEFRVFDTPRTLSTVLGLAAFTKYLVQEAEELLRSNPSLRKGDPRRHWMAPANKWSAIRYGLEGTYIRTPSGKRRSFSKDLLEHIERLLPVASQFHEEKYLKGLLPLLGEESGAQRQRRVFQERQDWHSLVKDFTLETKPLESTGLGVRRRSQKDNRSLPLHC